MTYSPKDSPLTVALTTPPRTVTVSGDSATWVSFRVFMDSRLSAERSTPRASPSGVEKAVRSISTSPSSSVRLRRFSTRAVPSLLTDSWTWTGSVRFATTEAYQTLVLEDYHAKRTDPVQVQLSVNKDGTGLVLNLLNRTEEDGEVEIDLTAFSVADGEARGVLLSADSLLSMNTLHDTQVAESPDTVTVRGGAVKATVKRLSFGEYVIPLIP